VRRAGDLRATDIGVMVIVHAASPRRRHADCFREINAELLAEGAPAAPHVALCRARLPSCRRSIVAHVANVFKRTVLSLPRRMSVDSPRAAAEGAASFRPRAAYSSARGRRKRERL